MSFNQLVLLSSELNEPCTNEFDSPLLRLTNDLHVHKWLTYEFLSN